MFETARTAVIWVGHVVLHPLAAVVRHALHFCFCFQVGCQPLQAVDVAVVHSEDEVEIPEGVQSIGAYAFGTCSKSLVSLFRNYKKETMLSNNYDEIKMAGFLLKNELQYE